MDSNLTSVWVIIRRYDLKDKSYLNDDDFEPTSITLKSDMNFMEIQKEIKEVLNIEDNKVVLKIRASDNSLVPLSYLLTKNTKDNPFIVEVTNVHQHALSGSSVPGIYAEAVAGRVKSLDKRIRRMENLMSDFRSQRAKNIEKVTSQLDYKVQFLDRRLDELTPLEWKQQLQAKSN